MTIAGLDTTCGGRHERDRTAQQRLRQVLLIGGLNVKPQTRQLAYEAPCATMSACGTVLPPGLLILLCGLTYKATCTRALFRLVGRLPGARVRPARPKVLARRKARLLRDKAMSSACSCGCSKRVYPSYLLRNQSLAVEVEEDIYLFACVGCASTMATRVSLNTKLHSALQQILQRGAKLVGSGSDPRRKGLQSLGVELPPLRRPKRKLTQGSL